MRIPILLLTLISTPLLAKVEGGKFFVGTSAFMLANALPDLEEPPKFYQANFGYQLSSNHVLSVELITWRYYAPLGLATNKDNYQGYVSSKGVGLAHQWHFLDNFYSALHVTYFKQSYYSPEDLLLTQGTQIFMTFRLGYHWAIGDFFLEPSLALTHWPINTRMPPSFQAEEDRWPKFALEPGLHLGFVF